jgi:hypothetical protein
MKPRTLARGFDGCVNRLRKIFFQRMGFLRRCTNCFTSIRSLLDLPDSRAPKKSYPYEFVSVFCFDLGRGGMRQLTRAHGGRRRRLSLLTRRDLAEPA